MFENSESLSSSFSWFILLCSLIYALPVIPYKEDEPNLDGIFNPKQAGGGGAESANKLILPSAVPKR